MSEKPNIIALQIPEVRMKRTITLGTYVMAKRARAVLRFAHDARTFRSRLEIRRIISLHEP
jgi:hypothetical protein